MKNCSLDDLFSEDAIEAYRNGEDALEGYITDFHCQKDWREDPEFAIERLDATLDRFGLEFVWIRDGEGEITVAVDGRADLKLGVAEDALFKFIEAIGGKDLVRKIDRNDGFKAVFDAFAERFPLDDKAS